MTQPAKNLSFASKKKPEKQRTKFYGKNRIMQPASPASSPLGLDFF
jgi:hypothetical protein